MRIWISSLCGAAAITVAGAALLTRASAQVPQCAADPAWLDGTRSFDGAEPADKENECEFYKRSWQAFLHVTSLTPNQRPAFLNYSTFRTLFLNQSVISANGRSLLAMTLRTPEPSSPVFDGGIDQALSSAVVDRNGNPVFYSIAIDPVFEKFVRDNRLNDVSVVRGTSDPPIPNGAIEIKAAWQIVEDPGAAKGFITTDAILPALKQDGEKVHADPNGPGRPATVALLGIHVVFKLENHPELIWATFEHIDSSREFDLAPRASGLPPAADPHSIVSSRDYILYRANTSYDIGNQELVPMTLQPDGKIQQRSSIYRAYPWSQIIGQDGKEPGEDEDVASVNASALDMLVKAGDTVRSNYKLVGAVWLRKGAADFQVGKRIDPNKLIGERGLSNMAIESLTQEDSPHCFSCHNPRAGAGMPAKAMNVSHLFEFFSKSQGAVK